MASYSVCTRCVDRGRAWSKIDWASWSLRRSASRMCSIARRRTWDSFSSPTMVAHQSRTSCRSASRTLPRRITVANQCRATSVGSAKASTGNEPSVFTNAWCNSSMALSPVPASSLRRCSQSATVRRFAFNRRPESGCGFLAAPATGCPASYCATAPTTRVVSRHLRVPYGAVATPKRVPFQVQLRGMERQRLRRPLEQPPLRLPVLWALAQAVARQLAARGLQPRRLARDQRVLPAGVRLSFWSVPSFCGHGRGLCPLRPSELSPAEPQVLVLRNWAWLCSVVLRRWLQLQARRVGRAVRGAASAQMPAARGLSAPTSLRALSLGVLGTTRRIVLRAVGPR
jgi:hypothetical protein